MNVQKERLLRVLKRVLLVLVRVMIRAGVDCRQFIEVSKIAYVQVATEEYGIRERKTNIARVAIMTGLTRKEVKRVRVNLESGKDLVDLPISISDKLLRAWHTDPDFQNKNGKPRILDFYDESSGFKALAKKYGGDVPVGALKTELVRTGLAKVTSNDKLRVGPRDPLSRKQTSSIQTLLEDLARAGNGIYAKTFRSDDWPFSRVRTNAIRTEDQQRMLAALKVKMSEHSERLEALFSSYGMIFEDEGKERIGLGVMQICFDEPVEDRLSLDP